MTVEDRRSVVASPLTPPPGPLTPHICIPSRLGGLVRSSNGTFVKGEKLGKGNKIVISDCTEIILMKSDGDRISYVFYFTQRVLEEEQNAKQVRILVLLCLLPLVPQ